MSVTSGDLVHDMLLLFTGGIRAMPYHLKFELCQLVHVHLEKNHSSYKDKTKKVAERRQCDGAYIKENSAENDKDDEKD